MTTQSVEYRDDTVMELIGHGLAGGGTVMVGVYVAMLFSGGIEQNDALGWVKVLGELPLTAAMLIGMIYAAREVRNFIADRDAKMKEITESYTRALDDMSEKQDAASMALVHGLRALEIQQATSLEALRTLTTEVTKLQGHITDCEAVQEMRRNEHGQAHVHPKPHKPR